MLETADTTDESDMTSAVEELIIKRDNQENRQDQRMTRTVIEEGWGSGETKEVCT